MQTLEQFYGPEIVDRMRQPLPADYFSYRSCKEYFMREADALSNLGPTGTDECPGARWHHGPLHFEKYVTDVEPKYDPTGHRRFVIWQRVLRTEKPPGWKVGMPGLGFRMTGFAHVTSADAHDWSSHARRHLSHYKKLADKGEREIVRLSLENYLAAYAKADQDRTMKAQFPKILREKLKAHGDRLYLMASRRKGGPFDAGLAFLHIPEARQSTHVSAFMAGAGKRDSASTGLIKEWFDACAAANIPYLDYGFFWAPGDPGDWKGFSRFKAQFGVRLIRYPQALTRWHGRSFWQEVLAFGKK